MRDHQPIREKLSSPWWSCATAAALIALIVACRLTVTTPNFQPVLAVALFSGFLWRRIAWGVLVVVAGLALADTFAGVYQWQLVAVVYLASLVPCLAGGWLRSRSPGGWVLAGRITLCSVASAGFFYLATNAAVWYWSEWYPHDTTGLIDCLVLGLPFLENTLLSNLAYAAGLFGVFALMSVYLKSRIVARHPSWCSEPVVNRR